jgi:hypothetical protein
MLLFKKLAGGELMSDRNAAAVKRIIPFAPIRETREEGDPMDRSGQAIVGLLRQAADIANSNSERAMDLAHKLSIQLGVAEEHIRELENNIGHFQDRAQRAEEWLARIYKDIEEKFFENKTGRSEQR